MLTFKKDLQLVKQTTLPENNGEKTSDHKIYIYQGISLNHLVLWLKAKHFILNLLKMEQRKKRYENMIHQ